MRGRFSYQDGMIVAGVLLLIGSIVGLYVDTVSARGVDEPAPAVIRVVTPTPAPSLTPLQPEILPTLPPLTPEAGEAAQGAFLVPMAADEAGSPGIQNPAPAVAVGAVVQVTPPGEVAAPTPAPLIPDRIVIPRLGIDAPVYPASYALIEVDGQVYQQWQAPSEYAAGWQFTSAPLQRPGNTVLNGHHNIYGQVFARLHELAEGDAIEVYSGHAGVSYEVSNVMIVAEEGQSLAARLENASWLQASEDERLTLVTCWPPDSNTHRVIVVARPVGYFDTQASPP